MSAVVRILGIDPGSVVTGYGVIEARGQRVCAIDHGCIQTRGGDHAGRLKQIFSQLNAVVGEYRPDEIAIERVFMHRNADSALKLGQARAAALCATFESDASIHEYAARQVKQSVAGFGGADKGQIQQMIRMLLKLDRDPQADAADALAVALCHSHLRHTSRLLERAAAGS